MKNSLVLSLFFLVSLWSCSKGGTNVKLNLGNSFSLSSMAAGAMLYVENVREGSASAVVLTGEDHKVTLPNGLWRFSIVGWEGNANATTITAFTGAKYCGNTTIELTGGNQIIDLPMSVAACNSDDFSPSAFRDQNSSEMLNFVTCKSLADVSAQESVCNDTDKGLANSIRMRLVEFTNSKLNSISNSDKGLVSTCIALNADGTGDAQTPWTIPFGRGDGLFAVAIESFTDFSCSVGKKSYFFPKGIANSKSSAVKVFAPDIGHNFHKMYLVHGGVGITGKSDFGRFVFPNSGTEFVTVVNNSGEDLKIVNHSFPAVPPLRYNFYTGSVFPGNGGSCILNSVIPSGDTCTLNLEFAPTAKGTFSKTLTLKYTLGTDTEQKTLTFPVTARSVNVANLTVSGASTITLASKAFGQPGSTQTYTLKNIGGYRTDTPMVTFSDPQYEVIDGTCVGEIEPGESCTLVVMLKTSTVGSFASTMTVAYNDGSNNQTIVKNLAGTVLPAGNIEFSPLSMGSDSHDFGPLIVGLTTSQTFTLTNNTGIAITGLSFSGFSAPYSFTNLSCGTSLNSGSTCQIQATYAPTTKTYTAKSISAKYHNGISNVTKTIQLQGTGLGASSLAVGVLTTPTALFGETKEIEIRIYNAANSANATSMSASALPADYMFKGGAFPGIGGTCNTDLYGGDYCSIVLQYNTNSGSDGLRTGSFNLSYFNGATYPVLTINLKMNVYRGALLVLDSPSGNSFGNVNTYSSYQKTLTLTNTGTHAATGVNFVHAGQIFTNSHSCPADGVLPVNSSCTITVDFTPTTAGNLSATTTVTYNDLSPKTSAFNYEALGKLTGPVASYYSNGVKWNDYVADNNPSVLMEPMNTASCVVNGDPKCVNGGEFRKVVIPGPTSCTGVTIGDSLSVFDWVCSSTTPGSLYIYSTGLKVGKTLRDLVDAASWKANTLNVYLYGQSIFQSDNSVWWSNPVRSLMGLDGVMLGQALPYGAPGYEGVNSSGSNSSGSLSNVSLIEPSAVYTVSGNISIPALHFAAPKMSLVTLGTSAITSNNTTGASTCDNSSGFASSPNDAVFICNNQDFSWIEAKLVNHASTSYGILQFSTTHTKINNSTISGGITGILISNAPNENVVRGTGVSGATTAGLVIDSSSNQIVQSSVFDNDGKGMEITGSGIKNIVRGSSFTRNSTVGLEINNGASQNLIQRSTFGFNNMGILLNTNSNSLNTLRVADSSSVGFILSASASMNKIVNLLSVNNAQSGLYLNGANQNTFQNFTLSNNGEGLKFTGASQNTFVNGISAFTSGANSGIDLSASANGNVFKLMAVYAAYNSIYILASNNNHFTKLLTGGTREAGVDCFFSGVTASSNTIEGAGISDSSLASCGGVTTNLNLATTGFQGSASASTALASLTLSSLTNFGNSYQYWGPYASGVYSASTAVGRCTGTNCETFDWRIPAGSFLRKRSQTGSTTQNGTFTPGSACPTALNGVNRTTNLEGSPVEFLLNAVEDMEAPYNMFNNFNGLCESNEDCIYSPNIGAYQGEGGRYASCIYDQNGITDVQIQAFAFDFAQ